jgi:hypothetical protein
MIKAYLFSILFLTSFFLQAQKIPTPAEFLGYELGEQFTPHHRVVDYFQTVANQLPNVKLVQYGTTYEGRPLYVAFLSTPENIDRLESIRLNNLKLTGLENGSSQVDAPAIVWLSYNVHGNESSSTEASMKTLHYLANPANNESAEWLKNVVVIMDPCINPDGRERYINYFKQYRQSPLQLEPYAMSHQEDWPGGRVNHYLFDLNRDWFWLSQKESQQRLALYNEWLPQIHVDFHEQSANSPYYFAPGAEPYHEVITDWQRDFQKEIGRNHARYFDKNNWVYFTAENFDLLYPSYGDTYPTFNGGIGMTYEQGGGGAAGIAVRTEYGDTLTLRDRLDHHFTTGISTVEIASDNASRLVGEFKKYFSEKPGGIYNTFVVRGDNPADKITKLTTLLDQHKIKYGRSSLNKSFEAFSYQQNRNETIKISENDVVISVNQPKGRLVRALFEPETYVSDSLTYDITAWSLPYAMGLNSYATKTSMEVTPQPVNQWEAFVQPQKTPYAYLMPYQTVEDGKFLGALLQQGIQVGVLKKSAVFEGRTFPAGSMVIMKANNQFIKNFEEKLTALINKHQRNILPVYTGMAGNGIDLGSNYISRIKPVKVGLVAGPGTYSNRVGEVWHFFEQQFNYPVTLLRMEDVSSRVLENFDVIVLADGSYGDIKDPLYQWIDRGGKVIAIGSSLNLFADTDEFNLSTITPDASPDSLRLSNYGMQERESISRDIPGAIFRVKMDATHPLAYGYSSEYATLTIGTDSYSLPYGDQVALMENDPTPLNGFAGAGSLDKIGGRMIFGVEQYGAGRVVYLSDNPLFRSFWENGKLLMINAVLLVD